LPLEINLTRRRWIADEFSPNHAALTGVHAGHLVRVLRARVGQEFDIVADGVVRRGRVAKIAEDRVDFELGDEIKANASVNLTLLMAIIKFDRMEWAIEKCTELGIARIIPIISRRTDAHLVAASAKRVERWRRMSVQASEQSRRTATAEVSEPSKLRDAVKLPGDLKIVLAETEEQSSIREAVESATSEGNVLVAVGPEGGWTEDELEMFKENGWEAASLGPTILRAETAAIAAVAITMSLLHRQPIRREPIR